MAFCDVYVDLARSFLATANDLKAICLLRIEGASIPYFANDISTLGTEIQALEMKLQEIRTSLSQEESAIRKMEEIIVSCGGQTQHLDHISAQLAAMPISLCGAQPDAETLAQPPSSNQIQPQPCLEDNDENIMPSNVEKPIAAVHQSEQQKRGKKGAEDIMFVSQAEFSALSAYMTQRLTLSKVNAAVESAAELAEANAKMLTSARQGIRLPLQERKRAQSLLVAVANHEQVKHHAWLTDWDLKRSSSLKPDKTGKALLTILRHLQRIQEVRIPLDGKLASIYLLLEAS